MIRELAPRVPTSQVLEQLLKDASPDHVTLAWLLGSLRERSFGILLLLIALVGLLPGASIFSGLFLLIPALQMILARPFPVLPVLITSRRLSTRSIARLLRHAVPSLRWLERFTYPRWSTPFESTKRVIGVVVLMTALSLVFSLPLFHILPALAIILIAFSFLEQDGLLLLVSLLVALVSIAITITTVWATVLAVYFTST